MDLTKDAIFNLMNREIRFMQRDPMIICGPREAKQIVELAPRLERFIQVEMVSPEGQIMVVDPKYLMSFNNEKNEWEQVFNK